MSIYQNALIYETSPYLLQHAHNPVNWYPWGEEALNLSVESDKPILVSIGYAACHWCHVMEKESFEDEATAAVMNEHFICIKIDREERPDLDQIYMDAVQTIAGNGGWPLNVFLTPETKPFFGGTYFPPVRAHGRVSWKELLLNISASWQNRREQIQEQANRLHQHLQKSGTFSQLVVPANTSDDAIAGSQIIQKIADQLLQQFDNEHGGFGRAPKFLQTHIINFLLQFSALNQDEKYGQAGIFSLKKMLNGGIYDQAGGGISRYSTDETWLVPHFEKMLYDNALLIMSMSTAFQYSKDVFFKEKIDATIQFLKREMLDEKGCYYTAIDADSEGVEGLFYLWTEEEVSSILGKDAGWYCKLFNVETSGNVHPEHAAWEHKNILHRNSDTNGDPSAKQIQDAHSALLTARTRRIRPATDDKLIMGNNALLLKAFADAYAATLHPEYLADAVALAAAIEATFAKEKSSYWHTSKNGISKIDAFLDDYAWYADALLRLHEVSGEEQYLLRAICIVNEVFANFSDDNEILFYYTSPSHADVLIRRSDVHDGATPSSNATMCSVLARLGNILGNTAFLRRQDSMLKVMQPLFEKYPSSFALWASNYQLFVKGIVTLIVTGQQTETARNGVLPHLKPHVVMAFPEFNSKMEMAAGKEWSTYYNVYVCKNQQCALPNSNILKVLTMI